MNGLRAVGKVIEVFKPPRAPVNGTDQSSTLMQRICYDHYSKCGETLRNGRDEYLREANIRRREAGSKFFVPACAAMTGQLV
ncbi:MAG: hypothetical protein JNM76_09715 [Betaproteobacteria bacterium]|nr:hypothetical protein [Betaproteobacteria bacterium]